MTSPQFGEAESVPEFAVYTEGLCFASVCTSLSDDEATARMPIAGRTWNGRLPTSRSTRAPRTRRRTARRARTIRATVTCCSNADPTRVGGPARGRGHLLLADRGRHHRQSELADEHPGGYRRRRVLGLLSWNISSWLMGRARKDDAE